MASISVHEDTSRRAILALETSHDPGSVALGLRERCWPSTFAPGRVHARELFPHIDALTTDAGLSRNDLGLVAVSAGPGSYTGLRIGVSAAKALAWALRIPVLAVSTLEVIAQNVSGAEEFAVFLDARRRACYGARFRCGRAGVARISDDACLSPAEFLGGLPPGTPLVGSGVRTVPEAEAFPHLQESWGLPRAESVLALAQSRWASLRGGETPVPPEFETPHLLSPRYLRRSEAEDRRFGQLGN